MTKPILKVSYRERHACSELNRRHPRGTQEANRRRTRETPRSQQEAPGAPDRPLKESVLNRYVFYNKSEATDHFRVDGSNVTLSKSVACAQKLSGESPSAQHAYKSQREESPSPQPAKQS